jgi:molecular chaperone GrpE
MGKQSEDKAIMDELQQQVTALTEALQRERADALNLQRRHEDQVGNLKGVVKAEVVRQLLPVIDNFERALKHIPAELAGDDYVKGITGIVKQFEKALTDLGVEKIKTVGQPFDPHLHEAVSMEDGEGSQEVVCEELQPGYKMGDQMLRHAMVRVRMQ